MSMYHRIMKEYEGLPFIFLHKFNEYGFLEMLKEEYLAWRNEKEKEI